MKLQLLTWLALSLLASHVQAQRPDGPAQKRGLLAIQEGASPGFTLLAPLRSHSTYLVDLRGNVAHGWKSDATPGHAAYLLDNGHLLRAEQVDSSVFHGGGQGGRIREFDWDGKIVWEYLCADDQHLQHHDFKRLPNGHLLMIAWELVGAEKVLAAGRNPDGTSKLEMWPDMLLEIEPTPPNGGRVVWEWHAWDHTIQDFDAKLLNYGDVAAHPERIDLNANRKPARLSKEERAEQERLRGLGYGGGSEPAQSRNGPPDGPLGGMPDGMRGGDWLHTNAIAYNPGLDVILLSVHNLNEIWVIDHSTTSEQARTSGGGRYGKGGDLLFRWGNPLIRRAGDASSQILFGQHDAHWIAEGLAGAGHVLVFNNGDRNLHKSSVDEFAITFTPESLRNGFDADKGPKIKLAWSYKSADIDSGHISGAQRLPNGNTLVCAGETGRLIELNEKNEVVWDFLNPLGGDAPMKSRRGGPPPEGGPDGSRERRPPQGDRRGPPPGFGGRGPGDEAHALFRAWRYAPDFPGLAKLRLKPAAAAGDGQKQE